MRGMTRALLVVLASGVLAAASSAAAPAPAGASSAAQPPAPDGRAIDKLIADLGSESFDVREPAQKRLVEIGEPAKPALQAAAKSADPEVRARAAAALKTMPDKVVVYPVAIYLVANDPNTHYMMQAEKTPLEELRLEAAPLLTEKDIATYEWATHTLRLTDEAFKRLPQTPRGCIPFVVAIDGRPVYLGAFTSALSSYLPRAPVVKLDDFDRKAREAPAKGEIRIDPPPWAGTPDPRGDPRIRKRLQDLGKLAPAPGASSPAAKDADKPAAARPAPPAAPANNAEALAARIAREKAARPDLANGPSAREKTIEHQRKMQIPEAELKALPTAELVRKVADTPLRLMMDMYPEPDGGLATFSRSYNGVDALLQRKDAAEQLMAEYDRLIAQIDKLPPGDDHAALLARGAVAMRFTVVETLLASPLVQAQLDPAGKRRVMARILASRDARAAYDRGQAEPVFGQSTLEWTALALAKCFEGLGDAAFNTWLAKHAADGAFVKRCLNFEEAKEVMAMAREHLAHTPAGK